VLLKLKINFNLISGATFPEITDRALEFTPNLVSSDFFLSLLLITIHIYTHVYVL